MAELFDKQFDALGKSLDLYLLRHGVIADNIANAETPYFKARKVDFEKELQKAIDNENEAAAISEVRPEVYEDPNAEMGQDLNTVDMDRQMAEMQKNDIKYSAATQAISKKFSLLKYAISETDK